MFIKPKASHANNSIRNLVSNLLFLAQLELFNYNCAKNKFALGSRVKNKAFKHGCYYAKNVVKYEIIGREAEIKELQRIQRAEQPEFLAVYGRRIKYGEETVQKIEIFREATKTSKAIFLTFITSFELKSGSFKDTFVRNDLTMDALFLTGS